MSSNLLKILKGGGKAWVVKPNCECLKFAVHLCKETIDQEEVRLISVLASQFHGQTVIGGLGIEHSAEHVPDGIAETTGQCVSSCFPTVGDANRFAYHVREEGIYRIRQFHLQATPM